MHFSRFFRTFAVEMRESVLNIIMTVIALAVQLAVGTGTRVITAVIPKYLSQRLFVPI